MGRRCVEWEVRVKTKDVLYYLLIVIVIVFMAFTVNFLYKNYQALKNPFTFGASQMGGVYCSCYQDRGGTLVPFYFNDTRFWTETRTVIRTLTIPELNESWDDLLPEK